MVSVLIIGFLSVAGFGRSGGHGEVGHEGGAVGVDLSPREAELRVVGVECDPKFFRFRWLCGSEGRGGLRGVVGERSFLE